MVAAVYQLLRFTILFFSMILALQGTAAAGAGGLVPAISAPALVIVLLLLQLLITGNAVLILPLRLTGGIQLITAVALLFQSVGSPLPVLGAIPGLMLLVAAFITVTDFAFLLFLLLYRRSAEET